MDTTSSVKDSFPADGWPDILPADDLTLWRYKIFRRTIDWLNFHGSCFDGLLETSRIYWNFYNGLIQQTSSSRLETTPTSQTLMVGKSSGPSSRDENNYRGSKAPLRDVLRGIFDRLRKTPFHPQWLVARGAEKHLQAVAGLLHGKVLDVGSGDRPLENYLKSQVRYIGLDYPPSGQRYRKLPHVWGDAIHLPFRSATIDSLVLLEVLEHLPYPGLALNEAARVLKDGGIAVVSVPFLYPIHDAPFDFGRITQYQIKRLAADTGFEVLRLTERGKALETATMLACLALAQTAIEALQKRTLMVLILLPTLLMVPILNIFGYVLSSLFPVRHFMPSGYLAVFKSKTDEHRSRPA